jgi:hypothetical protein
VNKVIAAEAGHLFYTANKFILDSNDVFTAHNEPGHVLVSDTEVYEHYHVSYGGADWWFVVLCSSF